MDNKHQCSLKEIQPKQKLMSWLEKCLAQNNFYFKKLINELIF